MKGNEILQRHTFDVTSDSGHLEKAIENYYTEIREKWLMLIHSDKRCYKTIISNVR